MKSKYIFILVAIFFLTSCGDSGSDSESDSITMKNYWQQIDWKTADGGIYADFKINGFAPSCSNLPSASSSRFSFFVRYGTVNKLVIYFQGGGACWHYNNCVEKTTYSYELMYYDNADILNLISNGQGRSMGFSGIFDFTNPENPSKIGILCTYRIVLVIYIGEN